MTKIFVSTAPFSVQTDVPERLLIDSGVEFSVNPTGRKLTETELTEFIGDVTVLIAGTERISERVIRMAPKLKLIVRVGIGLDSVDLWAARRYGIRVSYTPDAPTLAVAELTLCMMLCLLRQVHLSNSELHRGVWYRYFGRRLSQVEIGIIGLGRIGTHVVRLLAGFGVKKVLVNDIKAVCTEVSGVKIETAGIDELFRRSDIISLHVPLSETTLNLVNLAAFRTMRHGALLVNTARGGIVNESDLLEALNTGLLEGAAIDVFSEEPYSGPLISQPKCLLTSHMGSMSIDCRSRMEIEAVQEAIRFLDGQPLTLGVPESEFDLQKIET